MSKDCPKDKPFTGRDHLKDCVGCDTKSPLLIAEGRETDFDICPNRVIIDGESYLKTGNGLEVWNGKEKLNPCTDVVQHELRSGEKFYSVRDKKMSEENCKLCAPYRVYTSDGYCRIVKSPLENKPLISLQDSNIYELKDCDTETLMVTAPLEDCEKCPGRKYGDGYCYKPKDCPEGEFFTLEHGCMRCDFEFLSANEDDVFYDTVNGIFESQISPSEECSKCPNRMYFSKDVLLEEKNSSSSEKPFKVYSYFNDNVGCAVIQNNDGEILSVPTITVTIDEYGNHVYSVPGDPGFKKCDEKSDFYTLPEICFKCSNRVYKNGRCILNEPDN